MKFYLICGVVVAFFAINFIIFDSELMFYFFATSIIIVLAAVFLDAEQWIRTKL